MIINSLVEVHCIVASLKYVTLKVGIKPLIIKNEVRLELSNQLLQ